MAHRQRPRADEAFPAGAERQALDGAAGGIGAIEHPDGLAVLRRRFEDVKERGDEGVDAAAEILEVDEQHVERPHRLAGGAAHFAVEAEDGDAVDRIGEVGRFDHIVLLVAPEAVLRAEGGADPEVAARGEGIERMRQVFRDRSGMGEQGDAPARKRGAQSGVGEEPVDAEFHGFRLLAGVRA